MKRTFYALLICVAAVGVVLAVTLALEVAEAPPVVERFLSSAFGDQSNEAVMRFGGTVGRERMRELIKRYKHMLGGFVEIKSETARRTPSKDRIEVEVLVAFEKTDAPVRVGLLRTPDGIVVEELDIDAPPEFEMQPTPKSLKRLTAKLMEDLARRHPENIYDHFSVAERRRVAPLEWKRQWGERLEPLAVFDKVEPIGEPRQDGKGLYSYGHRLVFEKGVIVLRELWRWHDVYWILDELVIDEG